MHSSPYNSDDPPAPVIVLNGDSYGTYNTQEVNTGPSYDEWYSRLPSTGSQQSIATPPVTPKVPDGFMLCVNPLTQKMEVIKMPHISPRGKGGKICCLLCDIRSNKP
jgi:hypothetical protein